MLIPRKLAPISKLCDKDSSRFALGGVRLERDNDGKATATTCDGRRLITVEWNEAQGKDYPAGFATDHVNGFETIIPEKQWVEAMKLPLKRCPKPILENLVVEEPTANGKVTVGATDLETERKLTVRALEGKYPKWRDVLPKRQRHEETHVCVDSALLAETLSAMEGLTDGETHPVTIALPLDGDGPIVISATQPDCRTKAVLMPMDSDETNKAARERCSQQRNDLELAIDSDARHFALTALSLLSAAQIDELHRRMVPQEQEAVSVA